MKIGCTHFHSGWQTLHCGKGASTRALHLCGLSVFQRFSLKCCPPSIVAQCGTEVLADAPRGGELAVSNRDDVGMRLTQV